MHPWIWLFISAVFFAVGEICSKFYAMKPSVWMAACAAASSVPCMLFWLPAIRQTNQLAATGGLWSVFSLMITVLLGTLVFGEQMRTEQWLGIIFGFGAVWLLSV